MPTVFIDGKEFQYEGKAKALQFALDNGIDIPYFCWHPAMSIPSNCRMCLVEFGTPVISRETGKSETDEKGNPKIMFMPKPFPSCSLDITPGMRIRTQQTSKVVATAQKSVLEFILINHPLDCPICDQAGECPLQINTYRYGPEGSRFELAKVHKPKHVRLGPNVVFDAERCINCTRCTRFTDEISGSKQLTVIERGDYNFISTAPGKIFDDPYSLNTVDICPVGALTSSDFRFKARVWEMNRMPSICTDCAKGCNDYVWLRDNAVMRITPKDNPDVNQYWMCDAGRMDYKKYNENRVNGVKVKEGHSWKNISYEEGYRTASDWLKKINGKNIFFLASAFASVENNFVLKTFAEKLNARISFIEHIEKGWGDNLLRKDDRTPNRNGAEMLGIKTITPQELKEEISEGRIQLLYVMEDDPEDSGLKPIADILDAIPVIFHSYNLSTSVQQARLIFPASTSLEATGLYINCDRIAQMVFPVKEIKNMSAEMLKHFAKSRLDAGGQFTDNWRNEENRIDCLPSWQMLNETSKLLNIELNAKSHEEIFSKLISSYEELSHLTIKKLKQNSVVLKDMVVWE